MTEKEKMINGYMYEAFNEELLNDRRKAKKLCQIYNMLMPDELGKKEELLKELIGKIGINCIIEPNFFCDYGYNIEFGNSVYINHNSVLLDCAKIIIGNNIFIGPNCGLYTAMHPIDKDMRNAGTESAKPIIINDNVWLGGNVTVLAGVTIGSNSIIGAGSLVTKDIPNNVVAFGNPCKVIKTIE